MGNSVGVGKEVDEGTEEEGRELINVTCEEEDVAAVGWVVRHGQIVLVTITVEVVVVSCALQMGIRSHQGLSS